ncbi:MAG TPA: DNA repair protein RecN, partial [Longimicrobiales bacterium]|nr:DNA repair protein RecN [Longimicrobiales bacterium]
MLIELRIRNLAVVDDASVRLAPGLNVLTGETGAGKSIVLGALSLLVGERATGAVVRPGAERAIVEGVFDTAGRDDIAAILDAQGIASDDDVLILRREVAAEGRSRAWINGSPTTAGALRELGEILVDLHGQHEHQTLLRTREQRRIIDAFADATDLAEEVRDAHAAVATLEDHLRNLDRRREEAGREAEILRTRLEEIEAVSPEVGEEESLKREADRLEHAEELSALARELHDRLYAAEDAIAGEIDRLRRSLDRLVRLDPNEADGIASLDTAYYAIEDLGRHMGEYARSIAYDPERLEVVRSRLAAIARLRRKYGPSIEDVLETARAARHALDELDSSAWDRRDVERRLTEARERLHSLASELTAKRQNGAERLAREVSGLMTGLGLAGGRFEIALIPREEPGPDGAESIEFRVALNAGFEPTPLAQTASGGELSRIMLALKTVLARVDSVPVLVFDEIDAGIGGRVARHVAENLARVAEHHQVLVVTHLAQIAAR